MSSPEALAERIRYTLGDIGDEPFITDQEIERELALATDWRLAAASIADSLTARAIADPASLSVLSGLFSVSLPDQAKAWERIAIRLRAAVAAEVEQDAGISKIAVRQLRREGAGDPPEYSPRRYRRLR